MNKINSYHFEKNPSSYYNRLKIINGVKFTHREVDVMACLLSGKGSKTIAQFLSIEEKTVETHKYNIMRKLECGSKEGIIEFVERSDLFSAYKQHYLSLLSQSIFERYLTKISSLCRGSVIKCYLTYERDVGNIHLLDQMEKHLRLAGLTITKEQIENYKSIDYLIHHVSTQQIDLIIYLLSEPIIEKLKAGDEESKRELSDFTERISHNGIKTIFLLQNTNEPLSEIPQEIQSYSYVDLGKVEHYYFAILAILQKSFSNLNLEDIISEFKNQYTTIYSSGNKTPNQLWSQMYEFSENENSNWLFPTRFSKHYKSRFILGATLVFSLVCYLFFNQSHNNRQENVNTQQAQLIRSDLPVPADSTLLERSKLLNQINNSLQENKGIQTVALVGIGGAGKTTIARLYARTQKIPVVWELNAETNGSLMASFESLAYALCQSDDEKTILNGLKAIKNSQERREKIIFFVKNKLKSNSRWLLIFDNVDRFPDIQRYFPTDSDVWGSGKIIITTRDENIKNNNQVSHAISIGALEESEKLALFRSIIGKGDNPQFTSVGDKEIQRFLKELPPFPLDISTASYYLKTTNLSFEGYIDHLKEYNNDFEQTQESLMKEASEYTKTRYGIITLSLNKLINTNKDFTGLLLLVSLLDSQNIPIDLLSSYKNDVVVDNFIYNLKKHSLITNESSIQSISTLSVHRSMQAICLAYLIKLLSLNENNQLIIDIAHALEDYMAKATSEDDFSKMKVLISHSKVFLSHSSLVANNIMCSIRGELGGICFHLGHYEKAKQLLEENLAYLNEQNKKNYSVLARSLGYLANVYRDYLENYEGAKNLFNQSIQIYQKHCPDSKLRTAWVLCHLGVVYRELGEYEKAKQLTEQGLEIYKSQLLENHPRFPWVLTLLGIIYRKLGNYDQAKDILERSLKIYQNNFPNNHIRIAWALSHLGAVYRELKEYKIAKEYLEKSLNIYNKFFVDNHIEVIRAVRYLGKVYYDLGNYDKAKSLFEKSLAICEQTYGKDYIDSAWSMISIGDIYLLKGDADRAEELFKGALVILQRKKHNNYFIPIEKLADVYTKRSLDMLSKGDRQNAQLFTDKAIKHLQQSLILIKDHFPKNSAHVLRINAKLDKLM